MDVKFVSFDLMLTHLSSIRFSFPLFTFSMTFVNYLREKGKINWVKVFVWNYEKILRNNRKKILVDSHQPRGTHNLLSTALCDGLFLCEATAMMICTKSLSFQSHATPQKSGLESSLIFFPMSGKLWPVFLQVSGVRSISEQEHLQFSVLNGEITKHPEVPRIVWCCL